jgi:hypothetical protein
VAHTFDVIAVLEGLAAERAADYVPMTHCPRCAPFSPSI